MPQPPTKPARATGSVASKRSLLGYGMLQTNLSALDFSLLLPDVMTIADEVDSQLMQAMDSYMNVKRQPSAA
jgi:hypothetical protein